MHLHVLNIMVIMKITLFLLVVKNPSARKAIKSSHCSKKKMIEFDLRDCLKFVQFCTNLVPFF